MGVVPVVVPRRPWSSQPVPSHVGTALQGATVSACLFGSNGPLGKET